MDPAAWIGTTIDGRYTVEAVLGRGGMGTVLRAKHAFTGQQVAVKVLHPDLQLEPTIQQRFLAEAKAPNAIGHRSIVQVLDAGRTPEGVHYIAMELLVGRSLGEALRRGELSPELKKRVILDLLEALGHAHAKGFVHRDLKPDNVFLCGRQNDVKLLDFGIAKVIDDVRKTVTGALLGTPAYMAPEQLANASGVDSRADLWAMGVMIYEMMTGRLPIAGRSANEHLVALSSGQVTPIRAYLPTVTPEVEQFFARCLVLDPQQRFRDAAQMLQALAPLPFAGGATPASTMATGHSPMGTANATVGTVAPPVLRPHPASTPPPIMRPHPASTPPPVGLPVSYHTAPAPPAPGSKKVLWIVGGVAVALIVIGIVVAATRKTDTVAVLDAAAPRDAAPVEVVKKTCDEKCEWLENTCQTRTGSCESDCKNNPFFDECYARAEANCEDGVICALEKLCAGNVPSGTESCQATVACAEKCNTDGICQCVCMKNLARKHTLPFARFNACVSRAVMTACFGKTQQVLLACLRDQCEGSMFACGLAK